MTTATGPEPGGSRQKAGGRPSKLTAQVQEIICGALYEGHTRTQAARSAGVSRDSLYQWIKDVPGFSDAVEKAEGTGANTLPAARTPGGTPERRSRHDADILASQVWNLLRALRSLTNGGLVDMGRGLPPKCAAGCRPMPLGAGRYEHSEECELGRTLRHIARSGLFPL